MEWLNEITSKFEEAFNASVDYAYAHPKAGLVVVIVLLSVWLTGLVLGWKWTYQRPGNWGGHFLLDLLGPTAYRFWLGVVVAIAIGAAVCLSLQSCKNGKRSEAQKDVALGASVFRQSASCDTFLLNDGVSEFRVSLYNAFPPEYLATHDVYIVERTRHIDSISNLTVWYRLEKETLHPVDSLLWRNDAEF